MGHEQRLDYARPGTRRRTSTAAVLAMGFGLISGPMGIGLFYLVDASHLGLAWAYAGLIGVHVAAAAFAYTVREGRADSDPSSEQDRLLANIGYTAAALVWPAVIFIGFLWMVWSFLSHGSA